MAGAAGWMAGAAGRNRWPERPAWTAGLIRQLESPNRNTQSDRLGELSGSEPVRLASAGLFRWARNDGPEPGGLNLPTRSSLYLFEKRAIEEPASSVSNRDGWSNVESPIEQRTRTLSAIG